MDKLHISNRKFLCNMYVEKDLVDSVYFDFIVENKARRWHGK